MADVDPRMLRPGTQLRHRNGGVVTLCKRKADGSGWWNTDGSGLVDYVIQTDDWAVVRRDAVPPTADRLAFAFHWEYERTARRVGWQTQESTQVPWDELPEANRITMVATVQALLDMDIIRPGKGDPDWRPSASPSPEEGQRE